MTKLEKLTAVLDEIGVEYTTFQAACFLFPSIYVEIKATSTFGLPRKVEPKNGVFNLTFDGDGEYKGNSFYETGDVSEIDALRRNVDMVNEAHEEHAENEAEQAEADKAEEAVHDAA
ncbi:MAG: hypothetical protein GY906_40015 [bacterium]|nr:hypothetical protein [bacterium]